VIPWRDTDFYTSPDTLGVTASAVTVALVGLVGLVSLLVVALGCFRQAALRARAARAAEAKSEHRGLRPGFAVVHGRVETDDGEPAVRVAIRQRGRTYQAKGGVRHVWAEFDRQIVARSFFLRLASEERVKVEPGDDVLFVDLLSTTEQSAAQATRVRTAELTSKDSAYAVGRLFPPRPAVAYRSADEGFCLRPAEGERMLISTEPLEDRYLRRAAFHRAWLLACLSAFVFVNALVFEPYWCALLFAEPITASAVDTRTWTTRGKHGPVSHYQVVSTGTVDGHAFRLASDTNRTYYTEVHDSLSKGSVEVPLLVSPPQPYAAVLGTRPALSVVRGFVSWFALLGLSVGYALSSRRARPWYERKKVVDTGSGSL
jgi:hypothetical protein